MMDTRNMRDGRPEKFVIYEVISPYHVLGLYGVTEDGPYIIEDNGRPVQQFETCEAAMPMFTTLVETYEPIEEPDRRPAGRPPLYDERMEGHTIMFTAEQWSKIQQHGGAAYVRRLVDQAVADHQDA